MNLQDLLVKHGLHELPEDELKDIKALCNEVVTGGWFAGVNYANDRADHVDEDCRHPDRKTFMARFNSLPVKEGEPK